MAAAGDRIARDREAGFGSRTWYFPDGDRPPHVDGPYEPHEALLILNVADRPAHVEIDVFWTDRDPTIGLAVTIEAERVASVRVPWADRDGPARRSMSRCARSTRCASAAMSR